MDITYANFSLENYKSNYQILRAKSGKVVESDSIDIETIMDDAIIISKNIVENPDTILFNNSIPNDNTHLIFANLNIESMSEIIKFCNEYGLLFSSLLARDNTDEYSDIFTTKINKNYKLQENYQGFDYMSLKTFILYATVIKAIYEIVVELNKIEKNIKNNEIVSNSLIKIGKNLILLLKNIGEKYYLLKLYYISPQLTIFPVVARYFYSLYKANFYKRFNEKRDIVVEAFAPYYYEGIQNTFSPFYKSLYRRKVEYIICPNYLDIIKLYKYQKTDHNDLLFSNQTLTNITLKDNYIKFFNFNKFKATVYSIISDILNEENSKICPWLFYNAKDNKVLSKFLLKYLGQAILLETFFSVSDDDIIKKCAYERCDKFFSVRYCRHDKKYCSDECKSNKNSHNHYFKKRAEQLEQNKK